MAGVLGFFGARLQAQAGIQQAELQARVGVQLAEAETERLREQLAQPHLQNRQSTYHRFLNHERVFRAFFAEDTPITPEMWREWAMTFLDLSNGLILFRNRGRSGQGPTFLESDHRPG